MPSQNTPIFAGRAIQVDTWKPAPKELPNQVHIRLDATVFNRAITVLLAVKTPAALDQIIAALQACRETVWGRSEPGATLKPGWKLPMPPRDDCPCCHNKVIPLAVDTGDGWAFYWDCEDGCEPFSDLPGGGMLVGEAAWPFVDSHARPSDLTRAGFKVV